MKTVIQVQYDPDTAETVCKFADAFSALPQAVQMDIANDVRERMEALAINLQALIDRPGAGNS